MAIPRTFLLLCAILRLSRSVFGADCNSTHSNCPEEDNVVSVPTSTGNPTLTPSQVPTSSPSQVPTPSPSRVPTSSPSVIPSSTPSAFPSQSSSPTISASPTVTSTPTQSSPPSQSASPSQAPTISVFPSFSVSPTISAIPTQSNQPSLSASPSELPTISAPPSSAPTIFCSVNALGSFGETSSTIEKVVVEFGYELIYHTNSSFEKIGPVLEVGFNSGILPSLFPDACGSSSDDNTTAAGTALAGAIANYDGPPVVGISTFPIDQPVYNVPCLNEPGDGRKCVAVIGAVTLFLESTEEKGEDRASNRRELGMITSFLESSMEKGQNHIPVSTRSIDDNSWNITEEDRDKIKNEISNELEQAMNDGKFDKGVHPDIISVSYRDIDTIDPDAQPPLESNPDNSGGLNYGLTFGLIAGVGALFALGTGIAYKRKRDMDAEEHEGDQSVAQTEV